MASICPETTRPRQIGAHATSESWRSVRSGTDSELRGFLISRICGQFARLASHARAALSAIIPGHVAYFLIFAAASARVRAAALDRDRRADPRGQVDSGAYPGRPPARAARL